MNKILPIILVVLIFPNLSFTSEEDIDNPLGTELICTGKNKYMVDDVIGFRILNEPKEISLNEKAKHFFYSLWLKLLCPGIDMTN